MAWLKVFHLFGVIAWFAGLFYLPRLFVYHAEAEDRISRERFVLMEQRLLKIIMLPAAVLTIAFGTAIVLLYPAAYLGQNWFLVKLVFVLMLILFHFWCYRMARQFASGTNLQRAAGFRIMNEVPTLLLLFILVLTFVRPWASSP